MLNKLATEERNNRTTQLDEMTTMEVLRVMNEEDKTVPEAIAYSLPSIEPLVQEAINAVRNDGRIIYLGAGTSGRLGVLDAAECPPTFGTDPSVVVGIIAGGEDAFTQAIEGAEDSTDAGKEDMVSLKLNKNDVVIGLAASGRTPYVIGALQYAQSIGGKTGSIACNPNSKISQYADYPIEIHTGSEVLTGSTRLKAGTAQKLVLNMISTAAMVGVGKAYQNLMVDVKPTNEKLIARSKQMIIEATGVDEKTAADTFEKANQHVKAAIVMILAEVSYEEAIKRLDKANGFVKGAIS
ncbi:N-acetylmuramic acid 6-phosphate etherase [Texcoconibacillus texcoconensis]|uniref:N-acetylmuramic acid 6-phosphate etherase n=1 Tax=Texcoconibacillus texcoconensis TaxID=1095777 RepID=A0A840QLU9_9BACI|nr:N-acetylmuramic acid 6-phosphate etherase [Texcoconibacillus texcoconensis]MBB5172349.1 N-acetylmuramic acid 6-phosphate etherase [Texcoconibacillus texcoconensis]